MKNRPYRVAFLINPQTTTYEADAIINYSREKWGGRFNLIAFSDGNEISDEQWTNVKEYDPDIIYSFPQLSDDLKRRFRTFTSPLRVVEQRDGERFISVRDDLVSIVPTSTNISKIALGFSGDAQTLCFFIVDDDTPENIKEFLSDNFGVIHERDLRYVHIIRSRETTQYKDFKITSLSELNDVLLELGNWHNKFVFQSQICSLPNSIKETDYSNNGEKFEVVIGSSIQDKVYFWNRQLDVRQWIRTQITQLLINSELADNEEIHTGLQAFINRQTSSIGHDNSRGTKFVSFSLDEGLLNGFRDTLGRGLHHGRGVEKRTSQPIFNYSKHSGFINIGRGLDFHRANSDEEVLVINEPDAEESGIGGQSWFVDLYIEYRPENFTYIVGSNYWWQLPRRNNIANHCGFFNKPARINESGTFSVAMKRRSSFSPDENILHLKIPEDRAIFHALFCGEKFDNIDQDEGARFHSSPFYHMRRSDKGMYLSGVLSLFPNLSSATRLFEERFWRDTFEKMSNFGQEKDGKAREQITKTLTKAVARNNDLSSENGIKWLSAKVFAFAKQLNNEEVDMDYKEMKNIAEIETAKYNENPTGMNIPFDEKDFKDTLSDLVSSKILLVGARPKCPHCGYRIWYHLDVLTTLITCNGCGYEFPIQAESRWFYRLNSLVRAAVSKHGTVPLLLTLGELMEDSRSSSISIPSQELLIKEGDDLKTVREVDLICIKDGRFIIGEVKRSSSLFTQKDFDDMIDLAKQIRPDTLVFSSMDKEPTAYIKEQLERAKTELSELQVSVEWHSIRYWAFTPHPVR